MQPAFIRKLTAWPVPSRLRLPSSGPALRRLLIGFCPQDKVVIRTRFVRPTMMLPERATLRPTLRGEEPAARERRGLGVTGNRGGCPPRSPAERLGRSPGATATKFELVVNLNTAKASALECSPAPTR